MKKNCFYLLAAAFPLLAAAQSGGMGLAASASEADATFVQQAGAGGLAEVELSKIAVKESPTPAVREFAKQMIDDHRLNNKDLVDLANKKHFTTAIAMDSMHHDLMTQLQQKHGADLDVAYIAAMRKDHADMIALFEHAKNSAADSDLRNFAATTLPALKKHLEMAQGLVPNS